MGFDRGRRGERGGRGRDKRDGFGDDGGFGGSSYGGDRGGFGGGFGGGRNPLVIDEPVLQTIAETTGGEYYRAESAQQLQDALGDLPSQVTVVKRQVDIASWFACAGEVLVATALGLALWSNRLRTPSSAS